MVLAVREVEDASREQSGAVDVVVTTDGTAEGELVASALRARGLDVIESSLNAVEARALVDVPAVIIFDADEPGAPDAVMRVAAMPSVDAMFLLFSSNPAELVQAGEVAKVFLRPIDIDAVLAEIVLNSAPPSRVPSLPSMMPGAGSVRPTAPPELRDSDVPRIPTPASFESGELTGDDPMIGGRRLHLYPSPELARLLAVAEERANTPHAQSASFAETPLPSPVDPEVLALLDEPIDADDGGTGSGWGHAETPQSIRGTPLSVRRPAEATGPIPETNPGISQVDEVPRDGPDTQYADGPSLGEVFTSRVPELVVPLAPRVEVIAVPPRDAPKLVAAQNIPEPRVPRPAPRADEVWDEGGAVTALASAIANRASGSVLLGSNTGQRRVVLRDGDIVTAASSHDAETLLAFLAERGEIARETAARMAGKLPPSGRHAGAALIAHGHLGQDDLWPVLRAHAEWIIGRAMIEPRGTFNFEDELPARLAAEPGVFGGATGAEVFVELVRRVIPPAVALERMGGDAAKITEGARAALLGECALAEDVADLVRAAGGWSVGEVLAASDPELVSVLHALAELGVINVVRPAEGPPGPGSKGPDPIDEEALRERVAARRALVEEGDYFALLGVPRSATGYEIRRAYVDLRRAFEPARLLTGKTADLFDDLRLILEVVDEAYDILREDRRRERYRRAIEAGPPG